MCYLQRVEELTPQNECQRTFHDGINLGTRRKEKQTAQKERTALTRVLRRGTQQQWLWLARVAWRLFNAASALVSSRAQSAKKPPSYLSNGYTRTNDIVNENFRFFDAASAPVIPGRYRGLAAFFALKLLKNRRATQAMVTREQMKLCMRIFGTLTPVILDKSQSQWFLW